MNTRKPAPATPWPAQYAPTINASAYTPEDFASLRPGQWVNVDGAHGQYLGLTQSGSVAVNWKSGIDLKEQFSSNETMRKYAKMHNAK